MDEIEDLRYWIKYEQPYTLVQVAEDTGMSYRTLQKFVQGVVKVPRYQHVIALMEYRDANDTDAA